MEAYETEEQQVAAAKKWFKENGSSLVIGVVLGIISIGGWKYYQEEQYAHKIEASDIYTVLISQAASKEPQVDLNMQVDQLASNYADTPYAALASLVMAKHDYESGNIKAAISKLSWASKNATDIETQQIAATRLIRVYLSENMLIEAEVLLNLSHPSGFNVNYEELKGDLFTAKNEIENARVAYDKAIALTTDSGNQWLQLKRENLGN